MRNFYRVSFADDEPDSENWLAVTDYDLAGFDCRLFWKCERLNQDLPPDVVIHTKGNIRVDYLGNPLSWMICSRKLTSLLEKFDGDAIQRFDAPLYSGKENTRVHGYSIINPLRCVECVNRSKSSIVFQKQNPNSVAYVTNWVFDESKVPADAHVFRTDIGSAVFISTDVVGALRANNVRGIEFIECEVV